MRQKWARVFDMKDLRKVGKVEEQDFVEWGRRAAYNAGVKFTNELQQHWESAHRAYFGSNVTKKAFIQHLAEFAEMEDSVKMASDMNALLMKCVDLNGDGVVSWKEFYYWIAPLGVSEDEGKKAFDICDLDGNGTLDRDEFATACARYYFDMEMSECANFYGPYEEDNEIVDLGNNFDNDIAGEKNDFERKSVFLCCFHN